MSSLKKHFSATAKFQQKENVLEIKAANTRLQLFFFKDKPSIKTTSSADSKLYIAVDQLELKEKQLISIIQSKLQLNKKAFARKCLVKKINSPEAKTFLNNYHLMGYAQAAYHIGLFLNDELISVAAFSKGRKMNRLHTYQRSYELVRYCSKDGLTVTGGLSRLLKYFIDDKKPGDIMTYIDKQFGGGESYLKYGFKIHSEKEKQTFLVNKTTFERTPYKEAYDKKLFYKTENCGNLKFVYKVE